MENVKEDRRIRRTKRLLKQGLAELMQEREFKNITVKDITERMDLNRGTFYLHYNDTYDLLEKIETETLKDFQDMIDRNAKKIAPSGTLLPILEPILDYIVENADLCRVLFENKASNDFLLRFRSLIFNNGKDIISERFPVIKEERYEYFFSFITFGIIGLIKQWFEYEMALPKKEMVFLMDKVLLAAAEGILE